MNKRVVGADLKTILDDYKERAKAEMFCAFPGTIESFDSSAQTATISLNGKKIIKGGVAVAFPIIENCPVVFLFGGNGRLTMPIAKGDTCLVLFCDREIDSWFDTGITKAPIHKRKHDIADAIALVGIRSKQNKA
ncbi:MAG: Gp138 family membrane-puncturing spike protein, partial [Eubacteriales bacterium]